LRFNRLDLNQLVCLDALLSEASVGLAAERVHLSQPAMSGALARLREYFGDPLLVQNGRMMTVTAFGRSLAQPVRELILQAQALSQRRPGADPSQIERRVTLVVSDYVGQVILAPVLQRAEVEAPGLQFHLRPVSVALSDELDRGDVDMVITVREGLARNHPSESLFRESYVCVAWNDHPDLGGALTEKQYRSLGHVATVWPLERLKTRDELAVIQAGWTRRVEVAVPNFTMIPAYLVGTRRIATVQRALAQQMARQWPLQLLPCPLSIPDLDGVVQWQRHQEDDPALAWIRGALQDASTRAGLWVGEASPGQH